MLQTLHLDPGDLLQIKSTDLPSGTFTKLQAQSTSFLDITDPKAVLENAFRDYACLTVGDIFTFAYNDAIYSMSVLETKPTAAAKGAISVLETDLEVDFAPPVGYEEPKPRASGTNTPVPGLPAGGTVHSTGSMAKAINYPSIAPSATSAAAGERATSSNFLTSGHRLAAKKGSKAPTPTASTPVAGASTNPPQPNLPKTARRTNGPQPLRLPPGKLFFGYEIKPVKKKGEKGVVDEQKPKFEGQGQTLRGGKRKAEEKKRGNDEEVREEKKEGERTLRDLPR